MLMRSSGWGVCEEHKRELVDFNAAGSPKGVATSTRRRFSGAA
jgi:hypothetical protein